MSNDLSCIRHSAKRRVLVLDEDYLRICSVPVEGMKHDAHCTAVVLRQMEYWYCIRLKHKPQADAQNAAAQRAGHAEAQNTDAWIYKTQREMQDELMGLFGESLIMRAYNYLLARGFLTSRQNPNVGYDRTKQYLFMAQAVQKAVDGVPPDEPEEPEISPENEADSPSAPFRIDTEWKPYKYGMDSADIRNPIRTDTESNPYKYGSNTRDYDSEIESEKQQQQPPAGGETKNDEVVVVVSSLQKNGVSRQTSERFVSDKGPKIPVWFQGNRLDYLREQIAALRYRKPDNPGKILTLAIEEGWDFPDAYKDRLKPKPPVRVAPPATSMPRPKTDTDAPPVFPLKGKTAGDLIKMREAGGFEGLFGKMVADAVGETPPDAPPS